MIFLLHLIVDWYQSFVTRCSDRLWRREESRL